MLCPRWGSVWSSLERCGSRSWGVPDRYQPLLSRTGIYLAALKDAARLLDKVCSLCVNNNVIFFMATFAEFLPPSIMPLAMAHSGKPMHELRDQALLDDSSKPITVEGIEETEHYVSLLSDLQRVALPWHRVFAPDKECRQSLAEFSHRLLLHDMI